MKLSETVEMMNSEDYKERFKAEYFQLVIRYNGLLKMVKKWDAGELDFVPTCPRRTYDMQLRAMENYIGILEVRALLEGVVLERVLPEV